MSQYTRDEIIEKVKRGQSLAKADLKGANLEKVNLGRAQLAEANLEDANFKGASLKRAYLGKANLWGANLKSANMRKADLRKANLTNAKLEGTILVRAFLMGAKLVKADLKGAKLVRANLGEADLREANLREVELFSAVLNEADLSDADITGANIWGIARTGWIIKGIKAEYVYNCNIPWNKEAREKTRRDFKPGQFEALFKSLPTIEMVFEGGLSPQDYVKLVGLTEIIRKQKPDMKLEIKALEKVGLDTILRFTLSQDKYLEQAARLIAQLSQERGLGQKLLPILNEEYGIQVKAEQNQPIFKDCQNIVVNLINTTGEPLRGGKIGDIYNITGGNVAIGNKAIANYNAHQPEADKLLAELSQTNQELVETLSNALKENNQDKVQSTWEQIKEGISTSAAAYTILTTLGRLLGLPM